MGLVAFRFALPAAGVRSPRILEDVALVIAYLAWGMLRLRLAGMDLAARARPETMLERIRAFFGLDPDQSAPRRAA